MPFTASTVNSAIAWRPDQIAFAGEDILPDAMVFTASTVAGRIEGDAPSLRVAFCTDDTAAFVAEADPIAENQPVLAESLIFTSKIAQLVRISREQYEQNGTAQHLAASVARALTRKSDNAFLSQAAPIGPLTAPSAGLVNTVGIVSATAVATDLDKLIDLVSTLQTNGANPGLWIMSPTAWSGLRKLKEAATANNVNLLGAGVVDALPMLLSIPVVVNRELPAKTGLLVDKSAVISAVSPVQIATSVDAYFNSDQVAVRAVIRTGHTVPRADRLGKFVLT